MDKKLTKIVGLTKSEFDAFIEKKHIKLQVARLIPIYKVGDEMALTSVILSSMCLVKEFRKMVLSDIGMKGGQLYVYTEASFPGDQKSRVDGLIITVKNGVINDATLCEMKNGNDELVVEQIERYQELAKSLSIPRILTVSNQFVSKPTQFPITVKNLKGVDLYHFSWSYLLTLAHILLFDNDTNIEDPDQVAIMKAVVKYLEYPKSGICGFNQMLPGWTDVVERINASALLKSTDQDVRDAVISWQQEEKDIALILSRNLGVMVDSGIAKYRTDLSARIEQDSRELIDHKKLSSILRIKSAVSDITITSVFDKRKVEMAVSLTPPADKKVRGQLGWIRRQFEICKNKNESAYSKIEDELWVSILLKNARAAERVRVSGLDEIYEQIKDKTVKEFSIILMKDFGKQFASRTKFVVTIERMVIDFYTYIVQYVTKWEPRAPKMERASTEKQNTDEQAESEPEETTEGIEYIQPETAPCPVCGEDLVLSTLQIGTNVCPHCRGAFQAE